MFQAKEKKKKKHTALPKRWAVKLVKITSPKTNMTHANTFCVWGRLNLRGDREMKNLLVRMVNITFILRDISMAKVKRKKAHLAACLLTANQYACSTISRVMLRAMVLAQVCMHVISTQMIVF